MYRERKLFRKVAIIAVIIIISGIFFMVDYLRVTNKKAPIFCIAVSEAYDDGGSNELYGMFYKVNKYVYHTEGQTIYEIGPFWLEFDKQYKLKNNDIVDIYQENINIYSEY